MCKPWAGFFNSVAEMLASHYLDLTPVPPVLYVQLREAIERQIQLHLRERQAPLERPDICILSRCAASLLSPGCANADMVSFVSLVHSLIRYIRLDVLQTSSKDGFSSTKDQKDMVVSKEPLFVMPAVHLATGIDITIVLEAFTTPRLDISSACSTAGILVIPFLLEHRWHSAI